MLFSFLFASIGFICGFSLPLLTSRALKCFSCETGFDFSCLWHKPHFPSSEAKTSLQRLKKLKKLWLMFLFKCFFYGDVFYALFYAVSLYLSVPASCFVGVLLWGISWVALIDYKTCLLPDFITLPLLLAGLFAAFYAEPFVDISDSLYGAAFGYFLPLLVATFLARSYRNDIPLGGGDVKALTALGAWFGIYWFNIMLVLSCFAFAFFALFRKEKAGPFGPALAIGCILTVIWLTYGKHLLHLQ